MKDDIKEVIDKAIEENWFNTKSTGEMLDLVEIEAKRIHFKDNPVRKKSDKYFIDKMTNYIMSEIYYKTIGVK